MEIDLSSRISFKLDEGGVAAIVVSILMQPQMYVTIPPSSTCNTNEKRHVHS